MATDKYGIKKEKFSIIIVCCWLENGEDEWVHYWLERLIRNDKDHWVERFDTPLVKMMKNEKNCMV